MSGAWGGVSSKSISGDSNVNPSSWGGGGAGGGRETEQLKVVSLVFPYYEMFSSSVYSFMRWEQFLSSHFMITNKWGSIKMTLPTDFINWT